MSLGIEIMFFLLGALLLLTAILGGGFEIKELKIPTVHGVVRVLSGASGLAFVVLGVGLSPPVTYADVPPGPQTPVAAEPTPESQGGSSSPGNSEGFFRTELGAEVQDAQGAPYQYLTVRDDTGLLQVNIPSAWNDIDGVPYEDEKGNMILDVRASSDLDSFHHTWSTPGVVISASADLTDEGIAAFVNRRADLGHDCELDGGHAYDDGVYVGTYDVYRGCAGTDSSYVVITAMPEDGSSLIGAEMLIVDDRDLEALDQMIASFQLVVDEPANEA